MPERPPKNWWDRAVESLSRDPGIVDPRRLAGWIWHHWMTPEAKAQAVAGEFDPRPIESAMALLPKTELIRFGLYDPQFVRGLKTGLKEGVYRKYPYLRPKKAGRPAEVSYHYYHHFPGSEGKAFVPGHKSVQQMRTASKRKWGKPFSHYGSKSDEAEKERGEYQTYRHGYDPAAKFRKHPYRHWEETGDTEHYPDIYYGYESPTSRGKPYFSRTSRYKGRRPVPLPANLDPDHLGDLISRQQEIVEEGQELLQEMKERDVWIDEEYGPLEEEYGEATEQGEYDPRGAEYVCETCGQTRMSEKTSRGHARMFRHKVRPRYDPAKKKLRPTDLGDALLGDQQAINRLAEAGYSAFQPNIMIDPRKKKQKRHDPNSWKAPPEDQFFQEVTKGMEPSEKQEYAQYRKIRDTSKLMGLEEFQKKWADPNQRYKLRKLRAIYDPAMKRIIPLYRNLKAHDPKEYPTPIDVFGYADKHAGVMTRLVPDVTGLSPQGLEESVDPEKGGFVKVVPKGFLVEIQAKYPAHQFDNELLPRLIGDPTAEVDLKHGRIVLRAKNNLARNIFLDRDNN